MKFVVGLVVLCVCAMSLIGVENNFTIVGNYTKNEQISVSDKVEKSEFIIKNTFDEDLNLVWRKQSNSLLEGWDYSVCAYGQCSIGVPDRGQFRKIEQGEEGFFALHLFPKGNVGSGALVIDIYDVENPEFVATVTFNIEVVD